MTSPLKARYYKADGAAGKERKLPADPFDGVVHEESIHTAITAHLANRRRGTAAAKNRRAVRGGGRKPWRQKGTGRARVGSIRSPLWRGGGVIFPPSPRSYRQGVSKKVKRLARRSAFNARAAEGRLIVLQDLELEAPKTRQLAKLFDQLEIGSAKILLLTAGRREVVLLSARNLPNVEVREYGNESAYDVLWADWVVIEESALSGGGTSKGDVDQADEASDAEEKEDVNA